MKLIPERVVIIILTILLVISNVYAVSVGQKQIILTLGNNVAFIDGKPTTLEAAPATIKGRTMVPLRFIGEAFGAKVDWDNATKSATLTLTDKECPPCAECPKPPIHNKASIGVEGKESSSNVKSTLFRIESGIVRITGWYWIDFSESDVLYRASVIVRLYKEDGTLIKTFEAIGAPERAEYNECKKTVKYCLSLNSSTKIEAIEIGNYYIEVDASVDRPNKEFWSVSVSEQKRTDLVKTGDFDVYAKESLMIHLRLMPSAIFSIAWGWSPDGSNSDTTLNGLSMKTILLQFQVTSS